MVIDPSFVDYDFEQSPYYVRGDLGTRCFATKPPRYKDSIELIPESRHRELIDRMDVEGGTERLVTRIYNQSNEGSCVANACGQAHEVIQALQFGKNLVTHLAAMSLYKKIGRSAQSGAMVDDGLEVMAEEGLVPLDDATNRARFGSIVMPNTGFRTPYPANYESVAKQFRATEWFVVDSYQELMTALLCQHPVVVGRRGHSICYMRPTYKNGSLQVIYVNSWGRWGFGAGDFDHGFGADSRNLIMSASSWAFALRSVSVPDHVLAA
jgi:hypothetical protein